MDSFHIYIIKHGICLSVRKLCKFTMETNFPPSDFKTKHFYEHPWSWMNCQKVFGSDCWTKKNTFSIN